MTLDSMREARSLFAFLRDLLKLRNRPIQTLSSYSSGGFWLHKLDETPAGRTGLMSWGSGGLKGDLAQSGLSGPLQPLLVVPKINSIDPPRPPERLGPWISGDIDDASIEPTLLTLDELMYQEGEQETSDDYLDASTEDVALIERGFSSWIQEWRSWAVENSEELKVRKLYNAVFEARNQSRDQAQEWELVMGLGLLRLGLKSPKPIDRYLFSIPCAVDLDVMSGTLTVHQDNDSSYAYEDDWIQNFPKPKLEDLMEVKSALDHSENLDSDATKELFIRLAHKYSGDLLTDGSPRERGREDGLHMEPALILRKRGKQDLINLLGTVEEALLNTTSIPAPLQSLLEPGFGDATSSTDWSGDGAVVTTDDSTYLPLSLNKKQLEALERADTRNATIIQGPPGTGKTRTIAVMVSHFLAKGQRVLVTAETSQALREVRAQLPDEIRDLAVARLGGGKSDNDDLQKAVNKLVEAHENRIEFTDGFKEFEYERLREIRQLNSERATFTRHILDVRTKETNNLEFEGFSGSPANLALTYLKERERHGWIEDFVDARIAVKTFASGDAEKLIRQLEEIWQHPIFVKSTLILPEIEKLWSRDKLERIVELAAIAAGTTPNFKMQSQDAQLLLEIVEDMISTQRQFTNNGENWSKDFELASRGADRDLVFEKVARALKASDDFESLVEGMGSQSDINCPETSLDWLPRIEALARKILDKGPFKTKPSGAIKKPIISGSAIKSGSGILQSVRFNGTAPCTIVDMERLKSIVRYDRLQVFLGMTLNLSKIFSSAQRQESSFWLRGEISMFQTALDYREGCTEIRRFLMRNIPRDNEHLLEKIDLAKLQSELISIIASEELDLLTRELNLHVAATRLPLAGEIPEFVSNYLNDLANIDATGFEESLSIMTDTVRRLQMSREFLENIRTLFSKQQKLVRFLTSALDERPTAEKEQAALTLLHGLPDGLRWIRLGQFLGERVSEDYGALFRQVARCDDSIEVLVRDLAKRRAWKKALDRIDAETISNMHRYALESRMMGKGTSIRAKSRRREIRNYLNKCVPAIPAWIMPISGVAQFFAPELEMFDVVIIDEASQAGLDSIFLLALAKRIIVVGDHKQVSPDGIGIRIAEVQELADRHLLESNRRANWMNLNLSLFDECKAAFGNLVTLTEHRRCVPGIIGFSNRIAYEPEGIRLIPVRQTGSASLPPIRTIFVEDGYLQGTKTSISNPSEADAIVNEIDRMIKDPKYRNSTIGVITLQGNRQQEVIRDRITNRIDPLEIEKRQIRVGQPPAFQGSERNVILLSMVIVPGKGVAQTRETQVQRYNVAMSRAKDQVVLVHSLRASDIRNPEDLRRRLLDYCAEVENGEIDGVITSKSVPNDERVSPFDSLFEQRVYNRIVERGYSVIPQYRPEIDGHDYRIDLVVVGPYGKYAIECDGEFWHGEEQFLKDGQRQDELTRCGWRFFRVQESLFYEDDNYLEALWPELDSLGKSSETELKFAVDEKPTFEDLLPRTNAVYEDTFTGEKADEIDEPNEIEFKDNHLAESEGAGVSKDPARLTSSIANAKRAKEERQPVINRFAGVETESAKTGFEPIPEGYRSVGWIRPSEAVAIRDAYSSRSSQVLKSSDGAVIFEATYFPDGHEDAITFKANVKATRIRSKGPKVLGWIRFEEARSILEADLLKRSIEFEHIKFGHGGLVEYFDEGSAAAKTYRSCTRLLRRHTPLKRPTSTNQ